jgi:hypothetical protein
MNSGEMSPCPDAAISAAMIGVAALVPPTSSQPPASDS